MKDNGVDPVRMKLIKDRYQRFLDGVGDANTEPIKVFDPLPKYVLDELHLIRDVSRNLQAKKDEDVKKAAQAAQELAEQAKEAAEEQKVEEQPEKEK